MIVYKRARAGGLLLGALALSSGCVERIMTVSTDPQGARVIINDEEVGVSPARVAFLWYGDYDIIIRKSGYQTLKTHYRVDPPWYQIPPLDLISETMIPGTIRDVHVLPTFGLQQTETPPAEQVAERALQLRERALE
jgi:hypothetical protein